jgi:hypothetical protein
MQYYIQNNQKKEDNSSQTSDSEISDANQTINSILPNLINENTNTDNNFNDNSSIQNVDKRSWDDQDNFCNENEERKINLQIDFSNIIDNSCWNRRIFEIPDDFINMVSLCLNLKHCIENTPLFETISQIISHYNFSNRSQVQQFLYSNSLQLSLNHS